MPFNIIASNLCLIVSGAKIYHFGILTSAMHMAWMKHVCGRLKSDYRYSSKLVYNNFPWPEKVSDEILNSCNHPTITIEDLRKIKEERRVHPMQDFTAACREEREQLLGPCQSSNH